MTINANFQWKCHPISEKILLSLVKECLHTNSFIASLEKDLLQKTSTRLFDWIDHISIGKSDKIEKELLDDGYILQSQTPSYKVLHHPGAQLPKVVISNVESSEKGIAVSVDSIADFLLVRGMSANIEGTPFGSYRRCCVSTENGVKLYVIERRSTSTMEPSKQDEKAILKYVEATELWEKRPRSLENEDEAMTATLDIANQIIKLVGIGNAAWIVLEVERKYWQNRNTAAQIQKNRQDRLGMGWANHDHHTFRSSRKHFVQLVKLFEMLGFHCRERFYAGQEAGWGAQVMEHSETRLVLFLDVDLLPHEIEVDFRHQQLPELEKLGTVGLWCALHGDSILRAGMHHLEAQFMFDELKKDLELQGIAMMDPFSSFPYLHQAFTKGEEWKVSKQRVKKLLEKKLISHEQADKFFNKGAIGSHMENLQRREGYKGFNQKNVSFIIQKTDPRNINF